MDGGRPRQRPSLGSRPVSEEERINIAERLEGFRGSDDEELVFGAELSNHDRAVVHELCRKLGLNSKSHGKGSDRRVTVTKATVEPRKGSTPAAAAAAAAGADPASAEAWPADVPPFSFSAESQDILTSLLLQFPPTELEMTSALDAANFAAAEADAVHRGRQAVSAKEAKAKQNQKGRKGQRGRQAERAEGARVEPGNGAGVDVQQQAKALAARLQKLPALKQIQEQRKKLPIAAYRDTILGAVKKHQVVLIAGETGCGKTTQVPQFILDNEWEQGRPCKIICTQPRRISATSVAERIAAERGESVGDTVGYQIRLESKGGPNTSLWFCTNGVLLRKLVGRAGTGKDVEAERGAGKEGDEAEEEEAEFDGTHIIMDEIHERDRFADFMLIILRDLLPAHPQLRLVLMSATFNAPLFSRYFGSCPIIEVPGFIHPVRSYYLEDILQFVGFKSSNPSLVTNGVRAIGGKQALAGNDQKMEELGVQREEGDVAADVADGVEGDGGREFGPERWSEEDAMAMDEALMKAWLDDSFDDLMELLAGSADVGTPAVGQKLIDYQHSETGATALMVAAGKGRKEEVEMLLSLGADPTMPSPDGSTAADWARLFLLDELAQLLDEATAAYSAAKAEEASGAAKDGTPREKEQASQESSLGAQLVLEYQRHTDQEEVDLSLIHQLLLLICRDQTEYEHDPAETTPPFQADTASPDQAVLVFLPGWDEISRLRDRLLAAPPFSDPSRFLILSLHSMIPSADQRRVFARPPPPIRKLILTTNIAETALTIDDVVFVIDSGRLKEKSYDPYTNVATLQLSWVSKASARQREGRAGRCRAGVCFHLISRLRASSLPEFQAPEIKRTPLDELCLQVKMLDPKQPIREYLSKAVEPPVDAAVRNAITLLQDIGALDEWEQLTTLGAHLGALPMPPLISKMLFHAILLDCLGPALTVACASAYRDPFVLPVTPGQRHKALAARQQLSGMLGGGGDHLALVSAYDLWTAAREQGRKQELDFCEQFSASSGTLSMISGMRKQLLSELVRKKLVPDVPGPCNSNGANQGIIRAVLAAGMYPMVARLLPPRPGGTKASIVETSKGSKVRIHPHSVNFRQCGIPGLTADNPSTSQPLLVFDEVTRGESLMTIRSATVVRALPLILCAAEMVVAPLVPLKDSGQKEEDDSSGGESDEEAEGDEDEGPPLTLDPNSKKEWDRRKQQELMSNPDRQIALVVDRWLKFRVSAMDAAQLFCLRARLSAAFSWKVKCPSEPLPPLYTLSLYAIACILSFDGYIPPAAPTAYTALGSALVELNRGPGRGTVAQGQGGMPGRGMGQSEGRASGGGGRGVSVGRVPAYRGREGYVVGGRRGRGRMR